jgi:hypothetical protein
MFRDRWRSTSIHRVRTVSEPGKGPTPVCVTEIRLRWRQRSTPAISARDRDSDQRQLPETGSATAISTALAIPREIPRKIPRLPGGGIACLSFRARPMAESRNLCKRYRERSSERRHIDSSTLSPRSLGRNDMVGGISCLGSGAGALLKHQTSSRARRWVGAPRLCVSAPLR